MSEWFVTVVALLTAFLGGGGTTWFLVRANQRKLESERDSALAQGADTLVGSAIEIVETMKKDIVALRERVAVLEAQICERDATILSLQKQIGEQNLVIASLRQDMILSQLGSVGSR